MEPWTDDSAWEDFKAFEKKERRLERERLRKRMLCPSAIRNFDPELVQLTVMGSIFKNVNRQLEMNIQEDFLFKRCK